MVWVVLVDYGSHMLIDGIYEKSVAAVNRADEMMELATTKILTFHGAALNS